jgi:hypothetical protein
LSDDSHLRADFPRLDPQRICFARRSYVMGALYLIAIPMIALATFWLAFSVVDVLDKPGRYAPNKAVAGGGGCLSGVVKVSTLAMIALIVGSLWRQAKGALQKDSRKRFFSDLRLPVLYLRPFQADSRKGFMKDAPESSPEGLMSARFLGHVFQSGSTTEEYEVVQMLNQWGPVLAIGQPGEIIPPLGAARIYVHDEHWQDFVRIMTHFARVVFLRVGDSSGLIWELRHLRAECDPLKVLLFFPPTSGPKRNRALATVETELKVSIREISLAEWIKGVWAGHNVPYLFRFDSLWHPIALADSTESIGPALQTYFGRKPRENSVLEEAWRRIHDELIAADSQRVSRI